jgi:recombinational DNA repair protein RecR
MAYTPELSQIGSATLRRLAWYMGKPMTKSLQMLIELTATKMAEVRPGEVCSRCKDDRICEFCPFRIPSTFYRNL